MIRTVALLFAVLIIGASAFASKTDPRPLLEVMLHGQYGTQWTKVYKSGAVWVCKTEIEPYHETPVFPVSADRLRSVRAPASSTRSIACRDQVVIIDRTVKSATPVSGCVADSGFSAFLSELGRNCGR